MLAWHVQAHPEQTQVTVLLDQNEHVISYLQQHQGHVVERAALLRDVWGYEYAGGSNVIEANVRSLRRKLGDHAGSIETVRGLGYRFSVPVRSEADAPAHSMTSS